jgi:tetratricopeptide (TPR) repeat protein
VVSEIAKADFLISKQQYKQALLSCKRVLGYLPDDHSVNLRAGVCAFRLNRNIEAIKFLTKSLHDQSDELARYILGDIYFRFKAYDKARSNLLVYSVYIVFDYNHGLNNRKKYPQRHAMHLHAYKMLLRCMFEMDGLEAVTKFVKSSYEWLDEPFIYSQLALFYDESGLPNLAKNYEKKYEKLRLEMEEGKFI